MALMHYIEGFALWLRGTSLSWAVAGGVPWIWPVSETLHFVGLCLLFGVAGALDLRMLGVAKSLPIKPLQALVPFAVLGLLLNLVTGLLFFVGAPFQYIHNYPFWLKMAFLVLAGINVLVFQYTGLSTAIDQVGPGEDAPARAKTAAAASLLLWIGVIWWGRMLPFLGDAF